MQTTTTPLIDAARPEPRLVGALDTRLASTAHRATAPVIAPSSWEPLDAIDVLASPDAVLVRRPDRLRRIARGLPSLAAAAAHRRAAVIEAQCRRDAPGSPVVRPLELRGTA